MYMFFLAKMKLHKKYSIAIYLTAIRRGSIAADEL